MATNCNTADDLLFSQKEESTAISGATSPSGANKYGGLVPKKKPLISKDQKRTFFDSADWALHKQEACTDQTTIAAIEQLRPKLLQVARRQLDSRRPTCPSGKKNLADSRF